MAHLLMQDVVSGLNVCTVIASGDAVRTISQSSLLVTFISLCVGEDGGHGKQGVYGIG